MMRIKRCMLAIGRQTAFIGHCIGEAPASEKRALKVRDIDALHECVIGNWGS